MVQKTEKKGILRLETDDPTLRDIKDLDSLQLHPRFKARLDERKAILDSIIGDFVRPKPIQCAFGHWPSTGSVVTTKAGEIALIGSDCAKSHFGHDVFNSAKRKYTEEVRRQRAIEILNSASDIERRLLKHDDETESFSSRSLSNRMFRFWSTTPDRVGAEMRRMRRDHSSDILGAAAESETPNTNSLTKDEILARVRGSKCLWAEYDVRTLVYRSRAALKKARQGTDDAPTPELLRRQADLQHVEDSVKRLQEVRDHLESFLDLDNLLLFEALLSDKKDKLKLSQIALEVSVTRTTKAA